MATVIPAKDDRVRKVRVQVGAEWIEHDFGALVERKVALARALQMLETLA